jgi:hypothetical protein
MEEYLPNLRHPLLSLSNTIETMTSFTTEGMRSPSSSRKNTNAREGDGEAGSIRNDKCFQDLCHYPN